MKGSLSMNIEADRIKNVQFSAIRKVLDKASALRNEGKRVIALSAGEPNFNTPEPIKEECIRAINENYTHYGSNKGNPELRKIISKKIKEESGKEYDPESEIMFTTGGAEAYRLKCRFFPLTILSRIWKLSEGLFRIKPEC